MGHEASAFWQFSLRFYSRPEVPPLCLHLQDTQGVDVNLLFFMCFLGVRGRRITIDEVRRIDESIRAWRGLVVQPLRALRRTLKGEFAAVDDASAQRLREAIKRDELQAEQMQQLALERAFPLDSTGAAAAARTAAAENVAAYGRLLNHTLDAGTVTALLASLSAEFSL